MKFPKRPSQKVLRLNIPNKIKSEINGSSDSERGMQPTWGQPKANPVRKIDRERRPKKKSGKKKSEILHYAKAKTGEQSGRRRKQSDRQGLRKKLGGKSIHTNIAKWATPKTIKSTRKAKARKPGFGSKFGIPRPNKALHTLRPAKKGLLRQTKSPAKFLTDRTRLNQNSHSREFSLDPNPRGIKKRPIYQNSPFPLKGKSQNFFYPNHQKNPISKRLSTRTPNSNISNNPTKKPIQKSNSIKSKTSAKSNSNYTKYSSGSNIKKNFKKKRNKVGGFGSRRPIKAREEYFDSVNSYRSKSKNLTRGSLSRNSTSSARKRPSKNLSIGQFRTNPSSSSRNKALGPSRNLINSPYFRPDTSPVTSIRRKGKGNKLLSRDLSSGSKRRTHNILRGNSLKKREGSRTKRLQNLGMPRKPDTVFRPKIKKGINISKSPTPNLEIFKRNKRSPMPKLGRLSGKSPIGKLKQKNKKSGYVKGTGLSSVRKRGTGKQPKKKKRGNMVPLSQLYAHASRHHF